VSAVRNVGADGYITSNVGKGFPDISEGYRGMNVLIEIKDGSKPPSKRQLTPDQKRFHLKWSGQVNIAHSVTEAFEIIGLK